MSLPAIIPQYRASFFSSEAPEQRKPRFKAGQRVVMRENADEEFIDEMIVVERYYMADVNKWEYSLKYDNKKGEAYPPRVLEVNLEDNS